MKTLFTLSIVLLSVLCANAQVQKHNLNDKVLIIGIDQVTPAVQDGYFQARMLRMDHQIAFVSGTAFQSTYYYIYNRRGYLVKAGKFAHRQKGEYELIDIGEQPIGYCIEFSSKPLLANSTL